MDDAQAIHETLVSRARCKWSDYARNTAGQYVVRECSDPPASRTVRFYPSVDEDPGLCAIFDRLHSEDVLRVERALIGSDSGLNISVTRLQDGLEHGIAKYVHRSEMSIAPVLGLAFIEIMRTLDAEVSDG